MCADLLYTRAFHVLVSRHLFKYLYCSCCSFKATWWPAKIVPYPLQIVVIHNASKHFDQHPAGPCIHGLCSRVCQGRRWLYNYFLAALPANMVTSFCLWQS